MLLSGNDSTSLSINEEVRSAKLWREVSSFQEAKQRNTHCAIWAGEGAVGEASDAHCDAIEVRREVGRTRRAAGDQVSELSFRSGGLGWNGETTRVICKQSPSDDVE